VVLTPCQPRHDWRDDERRRERPRRARVPWFRCLTAAAHEIGPAVGVRATSPLGFGAFRRSQLRRSMVPVCLAGGIRSQSFSLSQRFDPSETSWLCFKPHPPIGFGPSELFPYGQPPPLSGRRALLSSNLPVADRSGQADRSSDFRAFIRPHVRHSPKALSRSTSRCSPGLSPLRGLPVPAAGESASPLTLHARKHVAETT